ncbi:MAG: aminotransferase class I/II-fold pyridoxal phosphate-dependent enzyme [Pseudomonadota bacterium]
MDFPARFSDLPEYAFPRLRRLLDGVPPGGTPTPMSIGEPMHDIPPMVGEILARETQGFAGYPPNDGTPELRSAIAGWVQRRFGVAVDPDTQILPLNGTREGLFNAAIALSPEAKAGKRPAVLLPNPFYQCYAVAALTAGAEPVYVNAGPQTGFLPDFAALPQELLARTSLVYMCSPSNPQGAVADKAYWAQLLSLAETHDFRIFADECYSEIWRDTPPPGILEVAHDVGANPERVVAFHSLSKRSNLAGLRSGAATSGPRNIAAMKQLRAYAGAPLPLPLQRVAEAVWADEAHVVESQALYREKFTLADEILGNLPGYTSPQAGFFLWLDVGDGERTALDLWQSAGVRCLPGAYLAREAQGENPGEAYIRLALVASKEEVAKGLAAVAAHVMARGGV